MILRDWLVTALIPAAVAVGITLDPPNSFVGLSYDLTFWLREHLFEPRYDATQSPVVVVAIDEETHRTPPFKSLPEATWTPQLARVLDGVIAGGARVVGFDIILSTSIESLLPNFDREFRRALRQAATADKVVLAKVRHQKKPLSPYAGYNYAVGHDEEGRQKNIHVITLFADGDGVIRRAPLFDHDGELTPDEALQAAFGLELAARALGTPPTIGDDRRIRLGDYVIPATGNSVRINFDGNPIPTYSLADLYFCAEAGKADFFRAAFDGKVVLVGSVLDEEDRRVTGRQYINPPEGSGITERCISPVQDLYEVRRRNVSPGVYVHAQIVSDLLRRGVLMSPPAYVDFALVLLLALAAGQLAARYPAALLGLGLIAASMAWSGVAAAALHADVMLPLLPPIVAAVGSAALLYGYRFTVTDRDKREMRDAFSYYLPPAMIDRTLRSGRRPQLGGELREVTVFFSDIADCTKLGEALSPPRFVEVLNRYFGAITEIVEAHQGFINRYTGDGVLALFGTPADDPEHARHAVEAAIECQHRLSKLQESFGLPDGMHIATRIGINTGPMVLGNIGSKWRGTYTVMGDAVNLASRLEGANKVYDTLILAGQETAAAAGAAVPFREIDRIRVIGRQAPVRIYQPLAVAGAPMANDPAVRERFAEALADYRSRRFAEAAARFAGLADGDPVSRRAAARALAFAAHPPPDDWDAVTNLWQK